MPTTDSRPAKRVFVVNATKFGVLSNWREVAAAEREGRAVAGQSAYFSAGDRVALTEEYLRSRPGLARLMRRPEGGGLPALEAIEVHEKRLAVEAKAAEAEAAAGDERAQLDAEVEELRQQLAAEHDRHVGATLLGEFLPDDEES